MTPWVQYSLSDATLEPAWRWDETTLLKIHLGIRLSLTHARTVLSTMTIVTREETPNSIDHSSKQRTRWNQVYPNPFRVE